MALEQEVLAEKKWKARFVVKKGAENLILRITDIALFYVYEGIVFVLDKSGSKFMTDITLTSIENQLDPQFFFRVNRQAILNIQYIKSYRVAQKVKLQVELTIPDFSTQLFVSQEKAPLFKSWISGE